MDIYEIKPDINRDKVKRKTKLSFYSWHRKYPHVTINGKGLISRLRNKNKKK